MNPFLIILFILIILSLYIYDKVKTQYKIKASLLDQEKNIENQKNIFLNQNKEILYHKEEITSSIECAKRIQTALLPPECVLEKYLSNFFLLYKPRDIVSGDFYWISNVKNKIIFAVADCTGHGIPGAFMSILGISLLNDIVNKQNISTPNIILNKLRDKIISSVIDIDNGMDIALISIDKKTLELEFSGAHNPCIIVRNCELIELKANPIPIGRFIENNRTFTNHKMQLEKGDCIYIFSDGFIDQFGGQNGKKLKSKYFKEILIEINAKSIKEQHQFLEEFFIYWSQGYSQVDDITIVGIEV